MAKTPGSVNAKPQAKKATERTGSQAPSSQLTKLRNGGIASALLRRFSPAIGPARAVHTALNALQGTYMPAPNTKVVGSSSTKPAPGLDSEQKTFGRPVDGPPPPQPASKQHPAVNAQPNALKASGLRTGGSKSTPLAPSRIKVGASDVTNAKITSPIGNSSHIPGAVNSPQTTYLQHSANAPRASPTVANAQAYVIDAATADAIDNATLSSPQGNGQTLAQEQARGNFSPPDAPDSGNIDMELTPTSNTAVSAAGSIEDSDAGQVLVSNKPEVRPASLQPPRAAFGAHSGSNIGGGFPSARSLPKRTDRSSPRDRSPKKTRPVSKSSSRRSRSSDNGYGSFSNAERAPATRTRQQE
jgi:hypothetical protein